MNEPRVALVSGFWGQNIGNAFFNVGGKWILDQLFGEGEVAFVQDQPGYRTFHDQLEGNPANDIELLRYLDLDYIVMQGPLLTVGALPLWRNTLRDLTAKGTRVILLGAAFFKFTESELSAAREFLDTFPPYIISTRDPVSYDILKKWGLKVPLYNGIDSAFFVPRAHKPHKIDLDFVTFNFDRYPEPDILPSTEDASGAVELLGKRYELVTPSITSSLAHKSKVMAYLGHLLDRRKLPDMFAERKIIRPEHRVNPHMTYKIYQHANAVASDEPWTYFTLYANSALTLADRVHACVISLAYGVPAMLFTPSRRAALFDAVGCSNIKNAPCVLPEERLEELQQLELDWLAKQL